MAPGGSGGATLGETVFSCTYIWKIFFKTFFSRTTGLEKLNFTWNLSDIAQNQVHQKHGLQELDGATIGETVFTCAIGKKYF
jgi:hypothetical protein